MKTMKLLRNLACVLSLVLGSGNVHGNQYISNLGNLWTNGGIGDIHDLGLNSGAQFIARFSTGAGSYQLSAVTLEFLTLSAPSWPTQSWNNISLRLYQQPGDFLGQLWNPVVSPTPTQWPQSVNPNAYTSYIDFRTIEPISLKPFTEYLVVANASSQPGVWASLLFTQSDNSTTPTDWQMGPTSTVPENPYAAGEFLKFAVDATLVPEPYPSSMAVLACAAFALRTLSKWRCGRANHHTAG